MILITGAAGYIGRHLTRALRARGMAVRALDCNESGLRALADSGAELVTADTSDGTALRAALNDVDTLYHLAGSPLGSPAEIMRANVAAAEQVAAACVERGSQIRALVYAGSGALYPSGSNWLDETVPPAPAFHYARAKARAEDVLLAAYARHGLPVLVARIAGVYGLRSPNLMTEQLRHGRFPLINGGRGYATYIHIDDTVEALQALAARGQPGQIYNLADDEPVQVAEFYQHLARLLGAPPPPSMPTVVARLLVGVVGLASRLRGRRAPLPPDLADMALVSHRMTNRRMREELGVTLRYPTYRDGLPTCVV